MNYFVKDINSAEHGPVNEQELIALVQQGLVTPECPVKKALMPNWEEAKHLSFLKEAFAGVAAQNTKKNADAPKQTAPESTKTSFENQLIPVHAGLWLRLQAFAHDAILLLLIFAGLALIATGGLLMRSVSDTEHPSVKKRLEIRDKAVKKHEQAVKNAQKKAEKLTEEKGEKVEAELPEFQEKIKEAKAEHTAKYNPTITDDRLEGFSFGALWTNSTNDAKFVCISANKNNAIWVPLSDVRNAAVIVFILFLLIAIPVHVAPLLLTAQTRGMRFYGIFLCDEKNYLVEVYEKRAYAYWLVALFTFWLTPFFVIIRKPTPAERLTGIRVTRTAAKKL